MCACEWAAHDAGKGLIALTHRLTHTYTHSLSVSKSRAQREGRAHTRPSVQQPPRPNARMSLRLERTHTPNDLLLLLLPLPACASVSRSTDRCSRVYHMVRTCLRTRERHTLTNAHSLEAGVSVVGHLVRHIQLGQLRQVTVVDAHVQVRSQVGGRGSAGGPVDGGRVEAPLGPTTWVESGWVGVMIGLEGGGCLD
jgi:hypothetical protein